MSAAGIASVDSRSWWETWTSRECVARSSTLYLAERGAVNDWGRTLYIYDHAGRIASVWRDGKRDQRGLDGAA